jgi:hypothetical protein
MTNLIFQREGVLNFTKGIPTSLAMGSIQQWVYYDSTSLTFFYLGQGKCMASNGAYGG